MSTLKQAHRAIGMAVDRVNREQDDFYPTPERGTLALLSVERFSGPIWEPACGDGAISNVLAAHGHEVISTDLVDRGFGVSRRDFLLEYELAAPTIITNPPFKLALQFMQHAWRLGVNKMAFLLRLAVLEGQERGKFYDSSDLARVWVFRSRLSMYRRGEVMDNGGMLPMAWFVWERGHTGRPELGWLP